MEIFAGWQVICKITEKLYRAVTKTGDTIDFYLSSTRNAKAAKRFLAKALRPLKDWEKLMLSCIHKTPILDSYNVCVAIITTYVIKLIYA